MIVSLDLARAIADDGAILHVHNGADRCARWRRNGALKTWKRDPLRFRLPLKHGLYAYDALTESSDTAPASIVHRGETCPNCGGSE